MIAGAVFSGLSFHRWQEGSPPIPLAFRIRQALGDDCMETELSPIVNLRDFLDNQSDRAEQTRRQGLQVLHVLRREAFPIPVVQ